MGRKRASGAKKEPADGDIFRLKVALAGIAPQIWRRLEVPDCTLDVLHEVIQVAMPWESYHMWCFDVGKTRYIDPQFMDFEEDQPATKTRLSDLFAAGVKKFKYVYDFGDDWVHAVTIEKRLPRESGIKYPRCTAGKRACPPEDCGGAPGYGFLLYLLDHPEHEEYEERMEWLGGPFDPEKFDLEAVNRNLAKLKP